VILTILLVTNDKARFSVLAAGLLQGHGTEVVSAADGKAGLEDLTAKSIDLVIVDEQLDDMTGIDFVKQVVKVKPLVNTAVVSILSAEDFHEATEGLGVLMQLPHRPEAGDAVRLLAILAKITGLMPSQAKKVTKK
jgi:DNA-binding response OmpR family regulator